MKNPKRHRRVLENTLTINHLTLKLLYLGRALHINKQYFKHDQVCQYLFSVFLEKQNARLNH